MIGITITPIYAALLGLILLILSVRIVVVVRAKGELNFGDGGNPEFTAILRGQGNFIEYVPLILILIAFAEAGGTSGTWIHAMGGGLVLGRILHPLGLSAESGANPFRFVGAILTWVVLLAASIIVLLDSVG
ncbi:MAG: hypothetical protein GY910_19395 [bacterium]|nr:hypothetical protein [bacterium]